MTDHNDAAPAASGREFLVVAHTGRDNVHETMAVIAKRCAEANVGLRVIDHDTMPNHPGPQYLGTVYPLDPAELREIGADVAVTLDEISAAESPPSRSGPTESIVLCASVSPVRSLA